MSVRFADIIIDISHEAIDKKFEYKIPEGLLASIRIGCKVNVPFGKSNSVKEGYVIDIKDESEWPADNLKSIISVKEGAFQIEGQLISLAGWMRDTYGSTMINALKTVMPVKEKVQKKKVQKNTSEISMQHEKVSELNKEQQSIVDSFSDDFDQGIRKTYLIHGVTGSGKTEVYIRMAEKVIGLGKKVIVLVPEIALTYQIVTRFKNHFGDRVSIINSQLSKGEKYREFTKAANGETDIMIGPRSALFAPFENIGLIIVDEEHDNAYKCDTSPKYHAVDTAIERARLAEASTVLGSATPSVRSYNKALSGEFGLFELSVRAKESELADVEIVDLREELKMGNRSIVSLSLYNKMKEAFDKKEQVMLFINRRGFNTFVSCRSCGEAVKCPRCDVSLSLHKNGYLMCHYCGHTEKNKTECPKCHSKLIGGYGTGTEKVEEEVIKLFPGIKTLRMDRDTTATKGAHGSILTAFQQGKADCLIGTQMIVKGHDFPNVTVVGIMLADLGLFDSDYEASERTFQLLTQAAGRAGRGDKKGSVVVQTYKPDHYAIMAAAAQDYTGFYNMEMTYRRLLMYPPVYDLLGVLITSKNDEVAKNIAEDTARLMKQYAKLNSDAKTTQIIGPGPAYITKINDVYRWVVYAKSLDYNILRNLTKEADRLLEEGYKETDGQIAYDFNPIYIV